MHTVTVHYEGKTRTVRVPAGTPLLDVLWDHHFEVYAPCGGSGTCGMCLVLIRDHGYVTSCLYPVTQDMDVVLPGPMETRVLASQYDHLRELPFLPGKSTFLSPRPFGVAIDLGTSTLAFYLLDLTTGSLVETRTANNPQSIHGSDILSRIHHCITRSDGLQKLRSEALEAINRQLAGFVESLDLEPYDLVNLTVAGNNTMLHILLGESPESLAFSPFTPVFTASKQIAGVSLGLDVHPLAKVHVLPSFSAYVGADVVAGLAALDPGAALENYLFVDVGTNGELALVTPERILCCATAAGPAFEGANLSCGMMAAAGAISRYRGPDDWQTIANAPPAGICGSGLVDIVASLLRHGVIRGDGFLAEPAVIVPATRLGIQPASVSAVQSESGVESEPESMKRSRPGRDILLTPGDVREVQLAKSAIAAGVALLLRHAGCRKDDIGAVYVAGGLGNYLQPRSAVEIGLFPSELEDRIIPVGNTSASGALLALKSERFGACLDETLSRMELFELSGHPEFTDEFAANMAFPDVGKIY